MEDQLSDKQTKKVLEQFYSWNLPTSQTCTPSELRNQKTPYGYQSYADIKDIKDVTIDVSSGKIGLRFYFPKSDDKSLPVFINLHGGGWVRGNISSSSGTCRDICHRLDCLVINVDYHLAPEHKFPIPFNDCYEATEWIFENVSKYGGDPDNVVLGGTSAGGNLTAAVALKARDTNSSVIKLKGQVLIVPVTNYNFDTESYKKYYDGYILTTPLMKWYWNHHLSDPKDGENPYASPLLASSHADLPSTLMMISEFDPLRDDGLIYAQKLKDDGINVELHLNPSIHGLISMSDRIDMGKESLETIIDFLEKRFEK